MLAILFCCLSYFGYVHGYAETVCEVRTRIDTGWVCGLRKIADDGVVYASFRGIPYAQQPLGELRFKELVPAKSWPHHLNATEEGPRCPQHDDTYGRLVTLGRGMSEACIYANVHVPLEALPSSGDQQDVAGRPIFVFVHGGGFRAGAGDSDLYGPEHIVAKGIVLITFNYRLNVFGFLSLNTSEISGNAGLRDVITLLRWVQRNAKALGGDPNDVTLGGQSAGSTMAHLVSLSSESKGLVKRLILMSGTAFPTFYTTSPMYTTYITTLFLTTLGINSTDPDFIHNQLFTMPLERIMNANSIVQYTTGGISFVPVVESKHPGVTRVLDSDPISLIEQGRGNYPTIIGIVNAECEFFRWNLEYLDMVNRIKQNPLLVLSPRHSFTVPPNVGLSMAEKTIQRYFHGKLTIDGYVNTCHETFFNYGAYKVADLRASMNGESVFMYVYSYESENNVVKDALYSNYKEVAHVEDMAMVFRPNAMLDIMRYPPSARDDAMKDWMLNFIANFIHCSDPTCDEPGAWPAVRSSQLNHQAISTPGVFFNKLPSRKDRDMIRFHEQLDAIARNSTLIGAR